MNEFTFLACSQKSFLWKILEYNLEVLADTFHSSILVLSLQLMEVSVKPTNGLLSKC